MISVRQALPSDFLTIARFQVKLALETENIQLKPHIVEAGVNAVFSDPARGTYYIAETGTEIKACLLTTREWSDWRNGWMLWIQSLYVLPDYRKKGIFRALYNHIKQLVEDRNDLKGIRLYVDKTNAKAIRVYRKCGMDDEHYQLFEWIKK
jgi:GNAT superfamily N-acetyltransferase